MIEVIVVTDKEGLEPWREQWLSLYANDNSMDLSASYSWLGSDFSFLTKNRSRKCYIAHDEGTLLGLLVCEYRWSKIANLIPIPNINTGSHIINDFVLDKKRPASVLTAIFDKVFSDHRLALWINFDQLTVSLYQRMLDALPSSDYNGLFNCGNSSSVFNVDQEYLGENLTKLSKKNRSNLRFQRMLEKEQGPLIEKTVIPASREENAVLFEQFLTIEQSGWKRGKGTAIAQSASSRAFHRQLCETAFEAEQMIWFVLTVNDELVAMNMAFRKKHILWVAKTTYNDKFSRYSPGSISIRCLLLWCIEFKSIMTVRLITDYGWHDKWNPYKEPYHAVRIFSTGLIGKTVRLLLALISKSWKTLSSDK